MPAIRFPLLLLVVLMVMSCKQKVNKPDPDDPNNYFLDSKLFAKYYQSLRFSDEFTALDSASNVTDKKQFFLSIMSGDFLPMRHQSGDSVYYKLIRRRVESESLVFLKAMVRQEYLDALKEGKPLPNFKFTSIDGQQFDQETIKDKIVVIKCWFIGCTPCIKEMPALNKLKASYKDRRDIVFLSLAFDKEDALKTFLSKVSFDYPVVAEQKKYMTDELGVVYYPTHILLDKKSQVVKIVGTAKELEKYLRREADKDAGKTAAMVAN